MHGIPSQEELSGILFNEDACKEWLVQQGIIRNIRLCADCGATMVLNIKRESYRHFCRGRRREMSMWKNTLFSRSKLRPSQILNLLYSWLIGETHTMMVRRGKHSKKTITQLIADVNEMVTSMIEDEECRIGGEGVVVEIDESKLSERKFNRGRMVNGVWVIGGVERTAQRKVFLVPVEHRDTEAISRVIEAHVLSGSIIYTDCWHGYSYLDETENYIHRTVNHSQHFKDPGTGVHTNTIEGTWAAIKAVISKRYGCEDGISNHLGVFIWRRQNMKNLWNALILALSDYHWLE
jgi:transposase-like protein